MMASLRGSASSTFGSTMGALSTGVEANDLLIVGPGRLGRIVAETWMKEFPHSRVYAVTLTTDHHDELMKMGIHPTLRGTPFAQKFPYVIFCAPPYPNQDMYPDEVREATLNWNGEGCFLFTSSSVLYECRVHDQVCNEDSPQVPMGYFARDDCLLKAEKVVLEAGGSVVRLARLYNADMGPHKYLLYKGIVYRNQYDIVNLIHYEDAASLSVAILKKKSSGHIFLGSDNQPLAMRGLIDLVNHSGKYGDKKYVAFTGNFAPTGMKLDNSNTRAHLGWKPKYPTFLDFLNSL